MTVYFKEAEFKALPDDKELPYYQFEGYVGAFGNVDSHDDILVKGAAAEQIGETIHFFRDHWEQFGAMDLVGEDDYGIKFIARAPKSDPEAVALVGRIEVGAPYKFSIGYQVIDSDRRTDGVRMLKKIKLMEGSIVPFASNDKAVLTGLKSRYGDNFVMAGAAQNAVETKSDAALVELHNIFKGVA